MLDSLFPLGYAHYLAGGLLLGAGMSLLFAGTGLLGGMSTLFTAAWSWVSKAPHFREARFVSSRGWRLAYALGLVIGAAAWAFASPAGIAVTQVPAWQLLAGGFVAGFGARLANGCTAGHGICGLASLRLPSLVAVLVFLATALLTANLVWALQR